MRPHTGLGERVFLLFAACLTDGAFTGGGRKQGAVLPVRMRREIYIGIEPFALGGLADVLSVCRSCRPIHELTRLVGAFIKPVDAPIGGEVSGKSYVLVRSDVPRQRHDDAAARLFGRVSVSGIKTGCIPALGGELVDETNLGMVCVHRQHGTASHGLTLTAVAFEITTDKATFVLGTVTVILLEFRIFLHGFGRADGGFQPFAQVFPCGGFIRPGLGIAAIAVGDWQVTHFRLPP